MDISECQVEALADPPKVQYVRATGKNRPETLIIKTLSTKTLSTKTLGVLVIGFPRRFDSVSLMCKANRQCAAAEERGEPPLPRSMTSPATRTRCSF
jgi:hypothetical protein